MTLYWADTPENIASGRTPGKIVDLLILAGFPPNNNANPQMTSSEGEYSWMVYPHSDYYLVASKSGYIIYDSRDAGLNVERKLGQDSYARNGIIHVGSCIIELNLQLHPDEKA